MDPLEKEGATVVIKVENNKLSFNLKIISRRRVWSQSSDDYDLEWMAARYLPLTVALLASFALALINRAIVFVTSYLFRLI